MDDVHTPVPPPPPRPRAKPPLWARFMEKLLQPWIEIKREPVVPPFNLDRPVCYVIENYGLSNTLILDRACREAGLPSPLASLPWAVWPSRTTARSSSETDPTPAAC